MSNLAAEKDLLSKLKVERNEDLRQGYINMINILNRAVSELLKESSPVKGTSPPNLTPVSYMEGGSSVFILPVDMEIFREVFRRVLKPSTPKKKLSGTKKKNAPKNFSAVKPSLIRSVSNSFFRGLSESTISNFPGMQRNVKAANMPILATTYLAVAYLFSMLSFFGAAIIYAGLFYLDGAMFWSYFWVIPVTPAVVFVCFVFYPKTEADRVKKDVSYELPFATIHMTAIAGSNIEPSKIFQIISTSKEYPNIAKEAQKILVMVQVYGYDLVTALKNVASRTSNQKLSELLGGVAANISGGGAIKNYLEKKADNYLLDYRLERKRYIDIASTFMDIYISILIAAPMILMLMFIIMNVSGIGFQGFSISFLMLVSIIGIAIVNVVFLVAINLKQPKV